MALDGKLLGRARERLARKKEENAALLEAREAEAYAKVPELHRIDQALRALLGQIVELTARRQASPEALAAIQGRVLSLCGDKAEALVAAGYPAEYLDPIVDCPHCRDTGYLRDGSPCACLLALYEAERSREMSETLRTVSDDFSDFSLDYYTGTARECMELTLDAAKRYAAGFGEGSPNLLFQGGTGLGKTFLSGCIAKAVSARGRGVVYVSAQEAFSAFEEQKFSRDAEGCAAAAETVCRILNCDLLILDDLGTELTTGFTQSALYNILNTRLTAGKKTLVSTNLSDEELAGRYTPQIVSRLNGEFDTLLFLGRDIRAQKKERRYQ